MAPGGWPFCHPWVLDHPRMILMVFLVTLTLVNSQEPVYNITIKAEGFKSAPKVASPRPQLKSVPTLPPLTDDAVEASDGSNSAPDASPSGPRAKDVPAPRRVQEEKDRSVGAHHFTPIVKRKRMPVAPAEDVKPVEEDIAEESKVAQKPPLPRAPPTSQKSNITSSTPKPSASNNTPVNRPNVKPNRAAVSKPTVTAKPNISVPQAKPRVSSPTAKPNVSTPVTKAEIAEKPKEAAPVVEKKVSAPVQKPSVPEKSKASAPVEKRYTAKPPPVKLNPLPKPNVTAPVAPRVAAKEKPNSSVPAAPRVLEKAPVKIKKKIEPKEVQPKTSAPLDANDPKPQTVDEVVVHSKPKRPAAIVPTKEIQHEKPKKEIGHDTKSSPSAQSEKGRELDVTSNSSSVQEALDAKHKAEEAIAEAAAKWQGKTITHQRKKKDDDPIKLKPIREIKQIKHKKGNEAQSTTAAPKSAGGKEQQEITESPQAIMKSYDTDGSGDLDKNELERFMKQQLSRNSGPGARSFASLRQ
eukprot:gnl/MRDRNA2_/MRDRNA2_111497_c0_seq1.p1 gnl/MRDRNA2_/MRDRNA2_111497_c0~~gnl/MRDRNA2_/MRDRNA2_111497_c0_seq1.p1  ORF type:complete len:523 (+),score=123.83 gnl/MRDRNA2_/MRDRNA2_111497_c0_seq1:61-1629(+)